MDFNGYYDSREFSVLTFNLLANLPNRFQYFSLTNFQGNSKDADLNGYFSEQNVRWNMIDNTPFDLTAQWVTRSGQTNDLLRFGFRLRLSSLKWLSAWLKKMNVFYFFNVHAIEFRNNDATDYFTQLEHVYNIKILPKLLDNRVYFGGFADQAFHYHNGKKITFNWVSEHQLGVRLWPAFYAVAEYRINDWLPKDRFGWGYGLEYKVKF